MNPPARVSLWRLAALFLRLSATSIGGPAAHIALMRQEVVQKRAWLTEAEFLDLLGVVNLIPGPNSTKMAMYIGYRVAGWPGYVVGGVSFILPAALIVGICGWAYVRYGKLPQVAEMLRNVQPVIVVIVLMAIWQLGRQAIKSRLLAGIALVAFALALLHVHELILIFSAGILTAVVGSIGKRRGSPGALALVWNGFDLPWAVDPSPVSISELFVIFLKIGAVLFGSGYVLLAFLRADFVERRGWLTEHQLLDAIVVGQVTPGPVFTTATFVGYIVSGPAGAALATVAIFLPAFLFVALSLPLIPRLRRSVIAGAFLDGVNVASLALMAAVTWQIGAVALTDTIAFVVAIVAAILLVWQKVHPTWLVLAGAALGLVRSL